MQNRLENAIQAAYLAGRSTLNLFQTQYTVEFKEDSSPVTQADKQAESKARAYLSQHYPGETILGEEQGLDGNSLDRWVIDPIDGTKSFIAGVPLYATLISYEVEEQPLVAACYFPALDQMIYASRGNGTFLNGRRVQVSDHADLERAGILTGSVASLEKQGRLAGLLSISDSLKFLRTWCDAYGHFLVATGRADAMIDPVLNRWDISSMALIVREAGGICTQLDGNANIGDSALSASPSLHAKLLELLNP